MVLSKSKIKELLIGAVNINEFSDGIRPFKCTEKQIKIWYGQTEFLGNGAESTTGITLDFHTDADYVDFEVSGGKFEVLINGVLFKQYIFADSEFHKIELRLDKAEKRITLVFPSHGKGGILKQVEIKNESFTVPHKFEKKILFLGDSITQGWNSKYNCLSYAYQVSNYFNAERVINGIGGSYYLPEAFDEIDFNPDIVIVAYGANDFISQYTNAEDFEHNATQFLGKIKEYYKNKNVIVITPIYMFAEKIKNIGTLDEHRDRIKRMATDFGFNVVDGFKLVPHIRDFFDDDFHPNDLGFSIYANKLISEINKIITV